MRVVVRTRLVWLLAILTLASLLAAPPKGVAAQSSAEDTLSVFDGTDLASNVAVSLAIADATFDTSYRVLISRDDGFADALASGYMQTDAPLILVPSTGPLPSDVVETISNLGAEEATILGGSEAISETVASELRGLGLEVGRREGPSRLETAIVIAQEEAPTAETVILARGYPQQGSNDPTQAFADSLATGGMAARIQAPILLTQSEVLSRSTAEYLESNDDVERVLLMGGTAAISDETERAILELGLSVDRIAGPGRADTAIEIAKVLGDTSADTTARVIAAESAGPNSWAAGFALAGHAAKFDAPIVLMSGDEVPPATADFLRTGIAGDPREAPVLTCAVSAQGCGSARVAAQLERPVLLDFTDIGPTAINLVDGETGIVRFQGLAGQRVSIGYDRLATSDLGPVCLDMGLFAPDDELLSLSGPMNCTDGNVTDGSERTVTLPVDGSYEVRARAMGGALTGRVFVTGLRSETINPDRSAREVEFARPGEVVQLTFFGSAEQLVTFGYRDLQSDTDGPICLQLQLFGPNRRTLESLGDPIQTCAAGQTRDGLRDPIMLPVASSYVLEASIVAGGLASVDVLVSNVESASIVPSPDPLLLHLSRPGAIAHNSFFLHEGVTVRFGYEGLSSTGPERVCIEHQLFGPNRSLLDEFNDPVANCSDAETSASTSFPAIRAPESGEYFLETSILEGRTGTVGVYLDCFPTRPDCVFG